GPSSVSSPGFSAMNVAVAVARIVGACATPVPASSPDGTSSARIGAVPAFAQSIHSAYGPPGGRDNPTPNRPSTISAGNPSGGAATSRAPEDPNAVHAAAASGGSFDGSPAVTTSTSKPRPRSARAQTNASPPLLPGPASTTTRPGRGASIAAAMPAAAVPARSINGSCA